jgi:predicted TPR repeat methyltransferase
LWKREQKILDQVLEGLPIPTADVAALDFACGSGRVVVYLESRARMVVGVDVSKDMIDVARTRVSTATLICGDIATGARADFPEPLHTTKYDLITAFRFFTNAEPDLRRSAMLALAQMLKSADSRLVFTVQAHVPSHKSLSRLGRRAQARLTHGAVGAAYMTERPGGVSKSGDRQGSGVRPV